MLYLDPLVYIECNCFRFKRHQPRPQRGSADSTVDGTVGVIPIARTLNGCPLFRDALFYGLPPPRISGAHQDGGAEQEGEPAGQRYIHKHIHIQYDALNVYILHQSRLTSTLSFIHARTHAGLTFANEGGDFTMLSTSGLSDPEKLHLDNWKQGRCSGRQAMLAILESKRIEEDSKGGSSDSSTAIAALGTVVKRAEEFALLSKSINLPEEFLCDSGLLYELVFSRPPSAVLREGLQMLATVALEKCSSALNVEQINLALKQMKIRSLQSQKNVSGNDSKNRPDEETDKSENESEMNTKNDDNSGDNDNDNDNKGAGATTTTDNNTILNSSAVSKKQQSLQAAETFRLQILTELIRMHIISLHESKSKSISDQVESIESNVTYESDSSLIINDSDDEESGFRKFKEGLKRGDSVGGAKNKGRGSSVSATSRAQFSDIESTLNIPLQSVVGHAESMPIDDLEASNTLLKPYIKQLAGLKALLSVQLKDLEDSKAYLALGISKNSSDSAIKKAYHSQAVKLHPDKPGGDTKKFQKLQDLYQEVLKKRKDDGAANEFSKDNENDPQTVAETNLANEFVSTMERVLGELQVEVSKCGELGQLNLQWQKNIDLVCTLPTPSLSRSFAKPSLRSIPVV